MSPPPTALEAFPLHPLSRCYVHNSRHHPDFSQHELELQAFEPHVHKTTQYCFYPAAFRYHCIWELIHPAWV